MSVIKNPTAKKTKRMKKDHRVFTWKGNKSFRGVWRKKKRRMSKQERRATQKKLRQAQANSAEVSETPRRQIGKRLKKTGVVTLERAIEIRRRKSRKRFSMFLYSSAEFEKGWKK